MSVAADVRALGVGAPLRAGYEASKRVGGHTLVFKSLVPVTGEIEEGRSPFPVRSVPDAVRDRTLVAADRIVGGAIELFGRELELGDPPRWHDLIHTEGSWPTVDWWKIDLRSDGRPGDVKWAWELGRHRHLVILARAAHLDESDAGYLATLDRHLVSWVEANPPEIGVHWYSNLEIALRAIAWLQILALVGDRLGPGLRGNMWRHLRHSGRHLVADLPYTVSTMRNNHLLGDGLGLIALGLAFGGKVGGRWSSVGDRIFERQLRRHMRGDGSMIEDSLSYHRFVLEMLSMRVVLGGASERVHRAMQDAAQFLSRLGVLSGPVPQYGDWDEGRLFVVAGDPTKVDGSVRVALALAGDGAPAEWREARDDVAWFVDEGVPVTPESEVADGSDVGGGIGRARVGDFTVWLKGGSGPSHGHADLSSVAIAYRGAWLVGDPGTGTYNGPIEERNYFRSSQAHNVLRVEGEDQLVPHRAFRWVNQATGTIGESVQIGEPVVMWAVHNAYTRLSPPRRVARVIIVGPDGVEVVDHVEGLPVRAEVALSVPPAIIWDPADSMIEVDGTRFRLEVPDGDVTTVRGSQRPYVGWWSDTYGTVEPTTVVVMSCGITDPVRWAILRGENSETDRVPRAVTVRFEGSVVRLRVEGDDRTYLRSV